MIQRLHRSMPSFDAPVTEHFQCQTAAAAESKWARSFKSKTFQAPVAAIKTARFCRCCRKIEGSRAVLMEFGPWPRRAAGHSRPERASANEKEVYSPRQKRFTVLR